MLRSLMFRTNTAFNYARFQIIEPVQEWMQRYALPEDNGNL